MAKNGHKTNWLVDAALFGGLLLSFWLDLTGVGWHQWLGVFLGALITYHFLAHWSWVEAIGQRIFGRTTRQPRVYFLLDLSLLAGFYLIGLTGLVISTWLGLALSNYAAWREFHVWASIATLALVVLKIGLHQGWIINTARRYFGGRKVIPSVRPPVGLEQTQLVPVTARPPVFPSKTGRRDFLILMGVVGAASLMSVAGVLHDPAAASGSLAEEDMSTQTGVESASQNGTQIGSASSSTCSVMCDRRCSYPGHCQRYQDSNGNGRCDWGECA
jgi:hypothetical protein